MTDTHTAEADAGADGGERFELLDLARTSSGGFTMQVTPRVSTPFHFLYGGAGIAAAAEASERATGRPLQWITTQFLGSPAPGHDVEIEVHVAASGRLTTQTRVEARVGGEVMLLSLCAHNVREMTEPGVVARMPTVPPPEDCDEFAEPFPNAGETFFSQMTRRGAAGMEMEVLDDGTRRLRSDPVGVAAIWCRLDERAAPAGIGSAATQAFVADVGPLGVCAKLGLPLGGTSLDNTLRMVDAAPSEWVLLELDVDGYSRSVGHSTTRLWSRDGRLLGVAQQSALIRTSHHDRHRAG